MTVNSTSSLYDFPTFSFESSVKSKVFVSNQWTHLKLLLNGLSGDSLTRVLGDCDAKFMSSLEDIAVLLLLDCILILLIADVTSLTHVLSSNITVL
jgi:hypothetical protein